MQKTLATTIVILLTSYNIFASQVDPETKKTYLEDVFIWKICDELKLSVAEEKKFTEINKSLNKKKSELNKKIQETVFSLSAQNPSEAALSNYKKLIQQYNQLSISEFESIKQILGKDKFVKYLKIKYELTSRIKSALVSDKSGDEKNEKSNLKLPPPKIIIEK